LEYKRFRALEDIAGAISDFDKTISKEKRRRLKMTLRAA
jgi:hypothetical protein